ncbi:erythroid differentiation-related factor 1-like [Ostrea edulis]|uniref:erythroid differentiation-related factor 1-like n=1 Tax=Ostrea edulis TaxID=37623 RepID=UPI0024AF7466|nr:erythroid differentiation-related factor 1-like [Ostrea edulis]XP_048747468.2 erythroid differentiation-related factor 1-like [Ostrea edulis]
MDAAKALQRGSGVSHNENLIRDTTVTSSSNCNKSFSSLTYISPSHMKTEQSSSITPSDLMQSVVRLERSNTTDSPDSQGRGEIKSVVRVKDPTLDFSPLMAILRPHTDLNKPPPNWLRRRPPPRPQSARQFFWPKRVSSFMMANDTLDLTGEVDVISQAKNIKKLLKMPFSSKSQISMMVHKVDNSLLIDDFDIHKNLLRKQNDDWKWLREFYLESVKKDMQMKCVPKKKKSRNHLQNKNMLSKFLYRSVQEALNSGESLPVTRLNRNVSEQDEFSEDSFGQQREVTWTFENIQMLIGTDLPIFNRGANYPCVSLRLRDMNTPINVLTGLDYWLDNLMCNVPEVAMCFHVDGIVQKYELIQTEDIPNLKDSEFDPHMVTDIACNILSFLKSNATKEGHTYWLYKGVDDDVVKLYDLTSLADSHEDQSTPFTVPLGRLLYRVACNMIKNGNKSKKKIQLLLENCLLLLDEEKHSQMCTSAHYLLSDVVVPDGFIEDGWTDSADKDSDEEETDTHSKESDNSDLEEEQFTSVTVKTLCKQNGYRKQFQTKNKPMVTDVTQRCMDAVKHTAQGLLCLDKDFTKQVWKEKSKVEEQLTCNKSTAIPLYYEPLQKSAPPHNDTEPLLHDKDQSVVEAETSVTWHRTLKALLLKKAAVALYTLARGVAAESQAGNSLRLLKISLQCFDAMKILLPKKATEHGELLCGMLGLAGDVLLLCIHRNLSRESVMEEMSNYTDDEISLSESVSRELESFEYEWVFEPKIGDIDGCLNQCCQCYQEGLRALKSSGDNCKGGLVTSLKKRFANIKNELGVWYMNQAQSCLQTEESLYPTPKMETLCQTSLSALEEGVSVFESLSDKANAALLYTNKGRLMRVYAQAHTQNTMLQNQPQFSEVERTYYNQALDCYNKALEQIHGGHYSDIWESVCWEMSTCYFNMAILLQDYAPLKKYTQDEVQREVVEFMSKSLKYCSVDTKSAKQPMCQYRAATIHHRLASLYHNSLRNQQNSEQKKKYLRQLMETHYRKAEGLFSLLECHTELLRVLLEQVAYLEYLFNGLTGTKSHLKTLMSAVKCLLDCRRVLDHMIKQLDDPDLSEKVQSEGPSLTDILESRLQFILLQLIKCFKANKQSKQNVEGKMKSLYRQSLEKRDATKGAQMKSRWIHLVQLLEELQCLQQDILPKESEFT